MQREVFLRAGCRRGRNTRIRKKQEDKGGRGTRTRDGRFFFGLWTFQRQRELEKQDRRTGVPGGRRGRLFARDRRNEARTVSGMLRGLLDAFFGTLLVS